MITVGTFPLHNARKPSCRIIFRNAMTGPSYDDGDADDAEADDAVDFESDGTISLRNCTTSFNRSNGAMTVLLIAPDAAPAAASTNESFIHCQSINLQYDSIDVLLIESTTSYFRED
mmetsp:Transcript_21773/g.51392  ORF Transcript_21773/g.51392 Transcript_21773/m.51392 type:complete len:117 (-) Transcript_21773:147-497(-)